MLLIFCFLEFILCFASCEFRVALNNAWLKEHSELYLCLQGAHKLNQIGVEHWSSKEGFLSHDRPHAASEWSLRLKKVISSSC